MLNPNQYGQLMAGLTLLQNGREGSGMGTMETLLSAVPAYFSGVEQMRSQQEQRRSDRMARRMQRLQYQAARNELQQQRQQQQAWQGLEQNLLGNGIKAQGDLGGFDSGVSQAQGPAGKGLGDLSQFSNEAMQGTLVDPEQRQQAQLAFATQDSTLLGNAVEGQDPLKPIIRDVNDGDQVKTVVIHPVSGQVMRVLAEGPRWESNRRNMTPTSAMKHAAALGLKPGTRPYNKFIRKAELGADTQININQKPPAPSGYMYPNPKSTRVLPIPGGPADPNVQDKPLPEGVQDKIIGGLKALDSLKTMKDNLSVAGFEAPLTWLQAKTGTNPAAVKFVNAQDRMRAGVQALIEGVPSNYDQQTWGKTIASIWDSEATASEKIKAQEQEIRRLLRGKISYYMGTRTKIPDFIVNEAKKHGINISNVKPWDGQSDPLMPQGKANPYQPPAGATGLPRIEVLGNKGGSRTYRSEDGRTFTESDIRQTARESGMTEQQVRDFFGIR